MATEVDDSCRGVFPGDVSGTNAMTSTPTGDDVGRSSWPSEVASIFALVI